MRVIDRDGTGLRTLGAGAWPAWSPDARHLVFGGFDPTGSPSGIEFADAQSGVVRPLLPWLAGAPEWQPHGHLIALAAAIPYTQESAVWLVRPDTGERRRIGVGDNPAWSSDSRLLAYTRGGSVCVIGVDGSGRRCLGRLLGEPPNGSGDLAWAPGRRLVADLVNYGSDYSHRGGYVIDVSTGRQIRVLGPGLATTAFGPSWSRDGRSLAFVTRAHRIFIVRSDGGRGHYLDLRPRP
jgi:Tol biopolymer transport system component